ncbi:MAG: (2Fe-2S)-binding protein, partial [Acetobacteraceae bacterium]
EGRRAAGGSVPVAGPGVATFDLAAYRMEWVRASVIDAAGEPYVCQCEEVTARDILEVRPPRYLGWPEDRRNTRELSLLLGAGAPNPDQVKRLTRAGMGLCQGRRCREQIAGLLALGAGVGLDAIPLATHRAPVRPLKLSAAAETAEPTGMAEHWDTWFGMPSQYVPYWETAPTYTAADADRTSEVASE